MHYKMRDQIRFKIGKEEKNIQEKWIEIPEGTEHIQMMIEMPEEFQYMAFLFLEDPKKEIRFQKLLGYGQQNPGIGKSTKDTTIGGVPGEIYPGTWKIGIGIFTEYVAQKLGEQTGEIVLTVSDRKDEVSDPIGGECWVENGLHISEKSYRWENVFVRNPDGIRVIFIRIRGCLTEKRRSVMLLKEQRKAVWIFMCRQNII